MKAARVALGVVAAAAATAVALGVAFIGAWRTEFGSFAGQDWPYVAERLRIYITLGAPVAAFFTLGFGAPLTHRRLELGRASALRTALTGLVTGALPFLLFDGYILGINLLLLVKDPYSAESIRTSLLWAGLGGWCGLCSALAYWMAVVPGWQPPQPR